MVIYGDILFIVNMIIDYLIIGLTATVVKKIVGLKRRLLASIIGGISSFYIFVESGLLIIDLAFRFCSAVLIIVSAFGFKNIRASLKALFVYYFFSIFLFGTAHILSVWVSAENIKVNNTYYYIGVSPLLLILFSTLIYIILIVFIRIKKGNDGAVYCEVTISLEGQTVSCKGLIDSGNSVTDILSDSTVFIASHDLFKRVAGCSIDDFFNNNESVKRCRVIPTKTVSGDALLKAVRCDYSKIKTDKRIYKFERPIVAVSTNMADEIDIIIPKEALEG